ncbi:MAG: TolB family protein [Candidatus Acidiferrales bacterium]
MRSRWAVPISIAAALLLLVGCGGSNSGLFNPTPVITGSAVGVTPTPGLFPNTALAGGPAFTLNIAGTGFIASSKAMWNGSPRITTFNVNTTQLSVSILAADIATPGVAQVTVTNPGPGGGTSSAASFVVSAAKNPVPTVSSLSPSSTPVGVIPPNGVVVKGTNFVSNSVVALNGSPRKTTFVSSTQLTAQLLQSDVAANASINVVVANPTPGGGTSAPPVVFSVGAGSAIVQQFPLRISTSARGGIADGMSTAPAMSADGRFVAFYSQARNLVASGPSGNIFVRDTCLGAANCTARTFAVDLDRDGSAPNANAGDQLAISADGRFAVFASYATNLAAGVAGENTGHFANLFVRDLCVGRNTPAGCTPHTELISEGTTAEPANNSSISPSVSADGRFVAFVSWATNLVSGTASSRTRVFVRDTCAGPSATKSCVAQTYLASPNSASSEQSDHPAISADGRFVAFEDWIPRLGTNGSQSDSAIVLRDTCRGLDAPAECVASDTTVSIAPDGSVLEGINEGPSVSGDGRFVIFEGQDRSGAKDNSAASQKILLRDTCLGMTAPDGCTPSTTVVSTAPAVGTDSGAFSPWISSSGRYVTFIAGEPASVNQGDNSREGTLIVRDTCFGVDADCTPQEFAVANPAAASERIPLTVDKFTPVMLTADGRFAAFFTTLTGIPAPSSSPGGVFLTPVRF